MSNYRIKKNKKRVKTLKPYGLRAIMTFGKHKGKMIADIAIEDPSYLVWLRDNKIIPLKPEVFFKPAS